jgi:hypothetical protein
LFKQHHTLVALPETLSAQLALVAPSSAVTWSYNGTLTWPDGDGSHKTPTSSQNRQNAAYPNTDIWAVSLQSRIKHPSQREALLLVGDLRQTDAVVTRAASCRAQLLTQKS